MANITWEFDDEEIKAIQEIVGEFEDNSFVIRRVKRNVEPDRPDLSQSRFWKAHLTAQLTSRQRSGPESSVSQFLRDEIDKLSLHRCREADNIQEYVATTLKEYGGIRRYEKIGEACKKNILLLDQENQSGWDDLDNKLEELREIRTRKPRYSDADQERDVCRFVYEEVRDEGLHQIGPKQSRNLLQALGLTRYETPLDSRITKWLNENLNLPYHMTGGGLSEPEFYDFHMDLVQKACREAEILPCVFDAAVFTSYSPDWPEDTAGNNIF